MSSEARVWLLTGPRPGEVAQQRRLAQALGESLGECWTDKPVFEPGAADARAFGWTPEAAERCGLMAPWPALAISFGKTLDAALWLRQRSGGQTRIVHLGRPRGVAAAEIDLIVPMPQDSMPTAPNVHRLRWPLNAPPPLADRQRDAAAQRLAPLPRPWTALVVGGTSRHFDLRLDALRSWIAAPRAGSLLVCTSPRTPSHWLAPLREALAESGRPHEFAAFKPGAGSSAYAEYLHLADRIVVTGDTASMIADAWRSGAPVSVLPVPARRRLRLRRALRGGVPASLAQVLVDRGWWAPTVDLDRWIATLAADGWVAVEGLGSPAARRPAIDDDLAVLVARIGPLLGR